MDDHNAKFCRTALIVDRFQHMREFKLTKYVGDRRFFLLFV